MSADFDYVFAHTYVCICQTHITLTEFGGGYSPNKEYRGSHRGEQICHELHFHGMGRAATLQLTQQ